MKKINLLCIIEDDPTHLFVIKKRIERSEMVENIIVFRNGKEAYDTLKKNYLNNQKLPEIILLDLNMPIWDGWQFLEEFTKLNFATDISIYILTSSNDCEDKKTAAKYNLKNNFLTKPINANEIKQLLNAATI